MNRLGDNPDEQLHVVPRGDTFAHEVTYDKGCPCGPTDQIVTRDDGTAVLLTIHHALDGVDRSDPAQDGDE